ncbi:MULTISPECIES: hypothetical protein [unclassified Flavobacterium]|uniref:hypothetical protein n=1 Tax=unclassified Flavobacterium TaxID=196869 RepID=UPI000F0CD71C|nr:MULTISPECIES: hypothetical protein [unclassified Flavobacterium]AYN04162.1 hypothetical protein EAG11_08135 [Flavobacterium sp. 140616W15]MCD0475495.1 hypothetical protein [Flavobacterium sp. EDS]
METDLDKIYIFKTNIEQLCTDCEVTKTLNNHVNILQWSIDTEDVDCVLRIVSESLTAETIINIINGLGHECQELN